MFARAVMQSGSFSGWVSKPQTEAEKVHKEILTATGCADVSCLERVPAEKLNAALKTIPAGQCCGHLQGTL
jgi:carboxylesterase type B